MVGNQDADVAVLQTPHDVLDILYGDGVYAGKGLIEHDKLGVDGQASGYLRAAALASRELVALVAAHLAQTELLDQALQLLQLLLVGEAGHLQHRHDVVLHTHLAKHAGLLRQVADARPGTLVHRIVGYLLIIEIHMALVGNDQPRGHVKRGGLARTVRSQQADNLSLLHIEVHAIGHCPLAVTLHQSLRTEYHSLIISFAHNHYLYSVQIYKKYT